MVDTCKNRMRRKEANINRSKEHSSIRDEKLESLKIRNQPQFTDIFVLIGILSVVYMISKNVSEYGFLMRIPLQNASSSDIYWTVIVHVLNTLRNVSFYHLSRFPIVFELIFILSTEGLASYVINRKIDYVYFRCWSHIMCLVYDMKLYSFAIYRRTQKKTEYSKYIEFLMFPVLVFRNDFKRTSFINYRRMAISAVKLIFTFLGICFSMDQLIGPSVCKLYKILNKMESKSIFTLDFIESSLTLSVSTMITFLMFFKIFFDYLLTIICELNRLDHKFFDCWWSSETAADFWRTWNVEFHEFAKIHIYIPLRQMGFQKTMSNFLIFLISGLIHEYALSMTVRSMDGLFLLAMLGQVPFYFVSAVVKRRLPKYANLFFLACFSGIGQPLVLYMIVSKYHKLE